MRILVCSDVPSAAQKIACLLEEKGYSVGTECDPAAARSGCKFSNIPTWHRRP